MSGEFVVSGRHRVLSILEVDESISRRREKARAARALREKEKVVEREERAAKRAEFLKSIGPIPLLAHSRIGAWVTELGWRIAHESEDDIKFGDGESLFIECDMVVLMRVYGPYLYGPSGEIFTKMEFYPDK